MLCKLRKGLILSSTMALICVHNFVPKVISRWSLLLFKNDSKYCFWHTTFVTADGFLQNKCHKIYLASIQHESFCFSKRASSLHQQLSHASVSWVQTMLRDKRWLPGTDSGDIALHSRSFITTKSCAHTCDASKLNCVVCLYANASTRSPTNQAPRSLSKNHALKENHLKPCDCMSNHYFSPIQGWLPHMFGKEPHGYTCGSLFVNHASRKILNFPKYSNTANKTITNK